MNEQDKELLETYMLGFTNELEGKKEIQSLTPPLLKAYNLGKIDAIVGDDVSSVDYQTNQQIINRIRNQNTI